MLLGSLPHLDKGGREGSENFPIRHFQDIEFPALASERTPTSGDNNELLSIR
jgi:hypothetical protein